MNDRNPTGHDDSDTVEANLKRLLGGAYSPVEPDESLVGRIEERMIAAAASKGRRTSGPRRRHLFMVPVRFWAAAMVLIAVNIAGLIWIHHDMTRLPQRGLRVLSALPEGNVDSTKRFALQFDVPLAGPEAVGKIVQTALFEIEPAPPGRWVWAAADRLEYELAEKLPPGQVFRIRPKSDIELSTGRKLVGPSEFTFKTRSLQLVKCHLSSFDRTHMNFELVFNQPVDSEQVLKHLRVLDGASGGAITAAALARSDVAESVVLRCPRPSKRQLRVELAAELAGVGAKLPLGSRISRTISLPASFALLRSDTDTPSLDEKVRARLYFSKPIGRQQQLPRIKVSPAVDGLVIERNWDDTCLVLRGKFVCGKRYTATVPATLLDWEGQTLGRAQSASFDIPDRMPAVRFSSSGGVLMPDGNLTAELRAVNVSELRVSAWRLYANNLVSHIRGDSPYMTSASVLNKDIALDLGRNTPRKVLVDLKGLLKSPKGIYRVAAAVTGNTWSRSCTMVMVTDLGITTKRHADGMTVWVTSLRTAQPVSGARVAAVTVTNQTLATAVTNSDGLAVLEYSDKDPAGRPCIVTAELDDDLSYVKTDTGLWVIDGVDQSGRPHRQTYDVMLYCERGVYRPGDTIHLSGILRDSGGQTPESIPLAIRVRRPDGKQVAELQVKAEAAGQGMFHVDFVPPADGQVGRYTFAATISGSKDMLGHTSTLVEAFVPVRMEVTATPTAKRYRIGDEPELKVAADYLWGQAAASLPMTVRANYRPVDYRSAAYPDFIFSSGRSEVSVSAAEVEGLLDNNGRSDVKLVLPEDAPAGLWTGNVRATVTEPGGRSVSATSEIVVDTLGTHVGLRLNTSGQVVPTDTPVELDWVCVRGDDSLAPPGEMTLSLVRVEYDTSLHVSEGQHVWKSTERLVEVDKRRLTAASRGTVSFSCESGGKYRAKLIRKGGAASGVVEFYASGGQGGPETLPMNRPQRLEIVLDRKSYSPGDTARASIRSPISGTLLITIETDRIVACRVAQVTDGKAEVDLPIAASVRGGAFVTASVIRAVDPSRKKWLPHRARGMVRLKTTHVGADLSVAIHATAKARPGQTVRVEVDTPATDPAKPPALVHLWAVDEGICLTTAFDGPDPHRHFFAPRRLEVTSSDIFSRLLPDFARPVGMDRIGADGDQPLDVPRRNPVPVRHRRPAVVWHRAQPVGPGGRLTVEMQLPELTGRLRLMAVAVAGDSYGRARADMLVTAPLLVESAWPRAAAPGDEFDVPVKFFNTTDSATKVTVNAAIVGGLEIVRPLPPQVTVTPGGSVTHWLRVKAGRIGPAEASIEAVAEGTSSIARSHADVSVRPPSVPHSETQMLSFRAGKQLAIRMPDDFVVGQARMRLSISAQPNIHLTHAIEKLIDYPYGCVEQTTSRLYSILYAPDLIAMTDGGKERSLRVAGMIDAGIARLWSMQTNSGGLGYWPGDSRPSLWGTAYATGFLLEARQGGYRIDKRFLRGLVRYLGRAMDDGRKLTPNTRALICRMLAVYDSPRRGWMARLAERTDQLDIAGRAHLAAAYMAIGRQDRAWAVLPEGTLNKSVATTTGGRLTGQVRQEAVLLSVLLDMNAEHPWAARLAARLEKARKAGHWGSTLSNAAALAALARYQALMGDSNTSFTGKVTTADGRAITFASGKVTHETFDLSSTPLKLTTVGTGTVHVAALTAGLAREGVVKPYDSSLTVRRRWLDSHGSEVDPASLEVGDLVLVEVTLQRPPRSSTVNNVAIVDVLPGGMEVENPRLSTSAPVGGQQSSEADRAEFLDDRVLLFSSAGPNKRTFRYSLRVTTAGVFTIPPIQASCMYDPEIASLGKAGRMEASR